MNDNYIQENKVYNLDAITFLECMYEDYGDESIEMFLVDFPYTFKGKNRVTANKWDLPVDIDRFFELALKMLTPNGVIALTASQPFASYLVYNHLEYFKHEIVWEKDNGSNFVHVKHQPFKVHEKILIFGHEDEKDIYDYIHEDVLIFGKAPTTYNKTGNYMTYNPQFTEGKPYKVKRSGMTDNLATSTGYERTDGEYEGRRYPRSVIKFNCQKGLHPTQKPVDMYRNIIKTYTDKGNTVVDICGGSGTTAEACVLEDRNFIINDNSFKYFNVINNRIKLHESEDK